MYQWKTSRARLLSFCSTSLISFCIAPVVYAAEDADNQSDPREIIVTAQKREQSLQQVPMSIDALGEDQIESRGISDLGELAMSVADVSSWDRGGADGRLIFIRGVGNMRGSSALVGAYVDEGPITGFGGLFGNALDLQMYDLERIEVLRGPQGTLYGDGSMGGTLRFITKDPYLDRIGGKADLEAGFTKDGSPSATLRGVMNLPLSENEAGIRIAAVYQHDGGWIDDSLTGAKDLNDERLYNIRVKGLWNPANDLTISAAAIFHRNDIGLRNTGESKNGDYTPTFFGRSGLPEGENDYEYYNTSINYRSGEFSFLSSTTYVEDSIAVANYSYRLPLAGPASDVTPFDVNFDRLAKADYFTQEIRVGYSNARMNVTLGGYYRDAGYVNENAFEFALPTDLNPFVLNVATNEQSKSWAVFGDVSYNVTDRFELGVGVRYFEDDRTSDDLASGTTQAGTFDALSPRIYARYELSDDVSIYANVAKGFRSGGFAGITGVNPYEPDTVWSYEAGVKASRIFDGLLSLDLTLYYSDYKNIQEDSVTLVNGAFTQFTINGGDAEIKGLDWNLSAYPTSDLTLGVSGNYVDTKYVAITGIGTHAVGDPLDMIPDHQISFWGQFDFDIFSDGEGFIRADYSRQGKAFWRERSVGPWYVSNSDILNTFNMRIGGRWENFSAEFFVQNITNDRGFVDPLSVIELAVRSRPRTIGIRFGVDFD